MAEASTKYKSLVKARTKALAVFQKAYDKLQVAASKVEASKEECNSNIKSYQQAIEEENSNIKFLETELQQIEKTTKKIEEFLS